MKNTLRVKARDTRIPWLPLILVAVVTMLASGCSTDEQPLVLTFDEAPATVAAERVAEAPARLAAARAR